MIKFIRSLFRSVNNLYLHWLGHRDKKYDWLDDYPHNYYPTHAEVTAGQIERYNRDRPVEKHFDIERDSFKENDRVFFVPDENTKDTHDVIHDRFYPLNDGT